MFNQGGLVMAGETCTVVDCGRGLAWDGLCWTHLRRRQRGLPMEPPIRELRLGPFERVTLAGGALAEAESEEEFRAAKMRLRRAAADWLRQLGWRPPK